MSVAKDLLLNIVGYAIIAVMLIDNEFELPFDEK